MNRKEELMRELMALGAAEKVVRISAPTDVLSVLDSFVCEEQEHFVAVTLNGAHEVIKTHTVSKGTANSTLVHPRDVFKPALTDNAVALIIAHNHPSGNTEPSQEDRDITNRLTEAGTLLGIEILDHVIVGRKGFYSFLENGEI